MKKCNRKHKHQKTAVLYLRTSNQQQGHESSMADLAAQDQLGQVYARRNGLKIVKIWTDLGSALQNDRPTFNQFVEHCEHHDSIQHIICASLSRLARNAEDMCKLRTLVGKYDKTIHCSWTNKILNHELGSEAPIGYKNNSFVDHIDVDQEKASDIK